MTSSDNKLKQRKKKKATTSNQRKKQRQNSNKSTTTASTTRGGTVTSNTSRSQEQSSSLPMKLLITVMFMTLMFSAYSYAIRRNNPFFGGGGGKSSAKSSTMTSVSESYLSSLGENLGVQQDNQEYDSVTTDTMKPAASSSSSTLHETRSTTDEQQHHQQKRQSPPKPLENINPYGESYSHDYQVLEVLPHDTKAFTQGLTYYKGHLYEGTGLHGQSEIRKLHPNNPSAPLQIQPIKSSSYFGEGITYFTNSKNQPCFLQLTWQEQEGFIYHADTLEVLHEFRFETRYNEGWGVTYDEENREFIVSDGSEYLHFWDRDSLEEKRRVKVTIQRRMIPYSNNEPDQTGVEPVRRLNELELVRVKDNGDNSSSSRTTKRILANVWGLDFIVEIDPSSGDVTRVYNMEKLYLNRAPRTDVLNGISVISDNDDDDINKEFDTEDGSVVVYVTGKLWPHMFKVKLLPQS